MNWADLVFGTKDHITPLQECARALLIFVYGLALVRLAGKRAFGKWAALDIVVSIIVGSNLSRMLTGSAPLLGTLLATTLLMGLHWLLAKAAAYSPGLAHAVEGRAAILVQAGRLAAAAARRHSVTEADLDEALRDKGLERVEEARQVTLEPSGKITVLKAE